MEYKEAIAYVTDLCRFGINLGLERTKKLLEIAGNPDNEIQVIHVAGTNGKGSTAAMLSECLQSAGFLTGLYTSPHLHSYRERIQINGDWISEKEFAGHVVQMKNLISHNAELFKEPPTEFEFLTVMSALYFCKQNVDYVIYETGLGGRLDSTNALQTALTIITNIGLDHQKILGESLAEIANEKAAVIRPSGQVVVAVQEFKEAEAVIYEEIIKKEARFIASKDILFQKRSQTDLPQKIWLQREQQEISLALAGDHQVENMLNVIAAARFLAERRPIDYDLFMQGFHKVFWPGRLEAMEYQERHFLLDVAHNPQGVARLQKHLTTHYADTKIYYLAGMADDKDKEGMIRQIDPTAEKVIISKPDTVRSENWNILPDDLVSDPRFMTEESISLALDKICQVAGKDDLVVAFGSFYFVSPLRDIIVKKH